MKKEVTGNDSFPRSGAGNLQPESVQRLNRQVARFERKQNPGQIARQLALKRDEMVQNYTRSARVACELGQIVKNVANTLDVPGIFRFWYHSFAREVEKLWRHQRRRNLAVELDILRSKWVARGLDPRVLERLQEVVIVYLRKKGLPQ